MTFTKKPASAVSTYRANWGFGSKDGEKLPFQVPEFSATSRVRVLVQVLEYRPEIVLADKADLGI